MFVLRWHLIVCSIVLINLISARIFDRCDLARTLRYKHNLSLSEVNIWTCIAQYQSAYDTEAVGFDSDGIGYHGIFQISDRYWCSTNVSGNACDTLCSQLLDDELTDDFQCIKNIFDEHQRISGNGYLAWTSYKNTCQYAYDGLFTNDCFVGDVDYITPTTTTQSPQVINYQAITSAASRIYSRCELARELWYVHQIPSDQIATWVCIADHASNFNTSAIIHRNYGGSGDHGIFQISDIYWCSPLGRGCGLSCAKLEDSDITDDVECIRKIYDEYNRLSGDGFDAWSVYRLHCKDRSAQYINGCFDYNDGSNSVVPLNNNELKSVEPSSHIVTTNSTKIKIYKRCELARELYEKHKVPMELVATYVCIAFHESKYNTSAVGRLNIDGSGDHGLFQISDIYWCSPPGTGRACSLSCSKLEDSDITDDVECMRKIYEEHTQLSGDGFDAWSVYNPNCKGQSEQFSDGCFDAINKSVAVLDHTPKVDQKKRGKIFERCELANQLRFKHDIPIDQISTWKCIAKYESSYNTSAVGSFNTDGSENHGLFQISDIYWCSPPGRGWVCGLSCAKLEDSDITDDVECMQKIYDEHQRLSGDGFNAWMTYKRHCKESTVNFAEDCFKDAFDRNVISSVETQPDFTERSYNLKSVKDEGKVYERCELARELKYIHNMSIDEVSNWVCIAYHESSYNTTAVGRLSSDGNGDHGLFQISDIYWCSVSGPGKACKLSCSDLENSNITDDVQCIRQIFEEHARISSDGFTAWTVYEPYCKGRSSLFTDGCFENDGNSTLSFSRRPGITSPPVKPNKRLISKSHIGRGKVYGQCELALELRDKYNFPEEQIATWVCIALHESKLNTSAIGHSNGDGSGDHGLFQISDIYWCSPPGSGWACGLPCSELEDSDISDDVECMKKIYNEHQVLSGDGFNAWSVYKPKCKGKSNEHVKRCFDGLPELLVTYKTIESTTTKSVQTTQEHRDISTTSTVNYGKYTRTPSTTTVMTTAKSTTSSFTKRNFFTNFLGSTTVDTPSRNSNVQSTLPTTLQHMSVTPITSKLSSSISVNNRPTILTSTTQSEWSRVQSLYNIYFNGFQTPRPTTQNFLRFATRPPIDSTESTSTSQSIQQIESLSILQSSKPLNLINNQKNDKTSSMLSPTNVNDSPRLQPIKRGTGFRFGVNVPAADTIFTTSLNTFVAKSNSTIFNKPDDDTLNTKITKSPFLFFNKNSEKPQISSSDATTTRDPYMWYYTTTTVPSKTTYQSFYSQRSSSTTSYSFPAYYTNRFTTTSSPLIDHFSNKHDPITTSNNRFTGEPSSTPYPKLSSLKHPIYDEPITTKSPFDRIFDRFVH